jgi:AraC-like DNA-binding protein
MAQGLNSNAIDYSVELEWALRKLTAGKNRIFIPALKDQHRRFPRTHFHPAPELLIQRGGGSEFECPGGGFRMETGDMCIMPRGVPHAETPLDTTSCYALVVCMHYRGAQYLNRGRTSADGSIEGFGTIMLAGSRSQDACRYLDDAINNQAISGKRKNAYIRSLLEVFLLLTISELEASHCEQPPAAQVSLLVRDAEQFIRSHLADPDLSVPGVAGALGYSSDYVSRRFHKERGLSLLAWIVQERVSMACDLLRDHRYNVAEVGWACGFNESSYFIRVFRQHRGVTPRQFREAMG